MIGNSMRSATRRRAAVVVGAAVAALVGGLAATPPSQAVARAGAPVTVSRPDATIGSVRVLGPECPQAVSVTGADGITRGVARCGTTLVRFTGSGRTWSHASLGIEALPLAMAFDGRTTFVMATGARGLLLVRFAGTETPRTTLLDRQEDTQEAAIVARAGRYWAVWPRWGPANAHEDTSLYEARTLRGTVRPHALGLRGGSPSLVLQPGDVATLAWERPEAKHPSTIALAEDAGRGFRTVALPKAYGGYPSLSADGSTLRLAYLASTGSPRVHPTTLLTRTADGRWHREPPFVSRPAGRVKVAGSAAGVVLAWEAHSTLDRIQVTVAVRLDTGRWVVRRLGVDAQVAGVGWNGRHAVVTWLEWGRLSKGPYTVHVDTF